tara:strand:+ start:50 stop:277 length:228 start_codon:yes stop_codon:yes gene_type:complete
MKATKKQLKMLEIVFNHKSVQNMAKDEYNDYLQMLLTLSLATVQANKGTEFCVEFVEAGLNSKEDQVIVKQHKTH